MKVRQVSTILLFFLALSATSQDVAVYLTGRNNGLDIPLDTIILQNLTQNSNAILAPLPQEISTYKIDLLHGSIIYSVAEVKSQYGFFMIMNNAGHIKFRVDLPKEEMVQFGLFSVEGKSLAIQDMALRTGTNMIDVTIGAHPFCVLKVKNKTHFAAYKCIGLPGTSDVFSISIGTEKSDAHTAGVLFPHIIPSNFVFSPGDVVRFSAIKNGMYRNSVTTTPQNLDPIFVYLSKPCPHVLTIRDYDGNVYPTVLIDNQCWMRDNLKTKHYADGTPLVNGTGAGDISNDYSIRYWFDYSDNPVNSETYGRLYTAAAAMRNSNGATGNIQGVCPAGWHVSSATEWCDMEKMLDKTIVDCSISLHDPFGTTIGYSLKETDTVHWYGNQEYTTDNSGFKGLPGGTRSGTQFGGLGFMGEWWVWDPYFGSMGVQIERELVWFDNRIYRQSSLPFMGFSIRCVKDQ